MPVVPRVASVSAPESVVAPDKTRPVATFSRQQRLPDAAAFRRVFEKPVKTGSAAFSILARPNGRSRARLGLAIPKRQLRRAVDRNRFKRQVRESFRHFQDDLAGLDIVVLVRNKAGELSNRQFREELARHWQRLKKKCETSSSS